MKIVPTKSIGNVDVARLQDSLARIHHKVHTPEGIRAHQGTRRELIEHGVKGRQIAGELIRRGYEAPDCGFCYDPNREFPLDFRFRKSRVES